MSVQSSVRMSVCRPIRMTVCPYVCLSVCLYVRVHMSIFPSVRLSICPYVCLSVSVCPVHLSACPSLVPYVCMFACPSVRSYESGSRRHLSGYNAGRPETRGPERPHGPVTGRRPRIVEEVDVTLPARNGIAIRAVGANIQLGRKISSKPVRT